MKKVPNTQALMLFSSFLSLFVRIKKQSKEEKKEKCRNVLERRKWSSFQVMMVWRKRRKRDIPGYRSEQRPWLLTISYFISKCWPLSWHTRAFESCSRDQPLVGHLEFIHCKKCSFLLKGSKLSAHQVKHLSISLTLLGLLLLILKLWPPSQG